MPDTKPHRYAANTFKYVNHQNGAALFFDLEGQPVARAWRAAGDVIHRITIEELKSKDDVDGIGFRTQNAAIIELPADDFRNVRRRLQRDLVAHPVIFEFGVNEEGSLLELYIDGQRFEPRPGRRSSVVSKEDAPSPQGIPGRGKM
jgi:hypothetical protein